MAERDSDQNITDCSVCHDLYTEPKILPCAHLLCRGCLISWMTANKQAQCPMCRGVIFDREKCKSKSCEQIVDSLPTDLAMAEMVDFTKLLLKEHVCCVHVGVRASFMCLQCRDMLCQSCADVHMKMSATRHHRVQELVTLTPEMAATLQPAPCFLHPDQPVKLFCSSHGVPVCPLCSSSKHRSCPEVISLEQMLEDSRQILSVMEESLSEAELSFNDTIKEFEELLVISDHSSNVAHAAIDNACNRLQGSVETCRQRLKSQVQGMSGKVKDIVSEHISQLQHKRGRLTSHRHLIKRVKQTVPCSSMSTMISVLNTRLTSLDLNTSQPSKVEKDEIKMFSVDEEKISHIERNLSDINLLKQETLDRQKLGELEKLTNVAERRVSNFNKKNNTLLQTATSRTRTNSNQSEVTLPTTATFNQSVVTTPTRTIVNQSEVTLPTRTNVNQSEVTLPTRTNVNQSEDTSSIRTNVNQPEVTSPSRRNINQSEQETAERRDLHVTAPPVNMMKRTVLRQCTASHPRAERVATVQSKPAQWYFLKESSQGRELKEYGPRQNREIEKAFQQNRHTVVFTDIAGVFYVIDFHSMTEYPRYDPSDRVQVIRK